MKIKVTIDKYRAGVIKHSGRKAYMAYKALGLVLNTREWGWGGPVKYSEERDRMHPEQTEVLFLLPPSSQGGKCHNC